MLLHAYVEKNLCVFHMLKATLQNTEHKKGFTNDNENKKITLPMTFLIKDMSQQKKQSGKHRKNYFLLYLPSYLSQRLESN